MKPDGSSKLRIAYLIAGAGGMYCGSCMRDNRLAATLLQRGLDVHPIPLYTPIQTDEPDVSVAPVHYGGIGLFLAHKSRYFRALPRFLQRLMDSTAMLRLASRFAIKTDAGDLGTLTVAILQRESVIHHRQLARLVEDLRQVQPGLIHLPNLLLAGLAAPLKSALNVPVLCTLAGEDVFLDALPEPYRRQACDLIRDLAADIDGFIAPTHYYASAMMERFGLEAGRLHHVPMGINIIDVEPAATRAARSEPFTIGYLARISPEKGLLDLAEAFIHLRGEGRDCQLRAAGYLAANDRPFLGTVRQRLAESGLVDDFRYAGVVDRAGKLEFLRGLDCLSVPTRYPEAKGLYVLEALMMGVPVVLPRRGSFPELVEATGGGLLYDPANTTNLASAIAELMDNPEQQAQLGRAGHQVVATSFNADVMADAAWAVFQKYAGRQAAQAD